MKPISETLYSTENQTEYEWLFDYHYALNRLRHNTSFKFGRSNPPEDSRLFSEEKNMMAGFIVVATQQFPKEVAIPFFPLVFTFLQDVRPEIKKYQKSITQL